MEALKSLPVFASHSPGIASPRTSDVARVRQPSTVRGAVVSYRGVSVESRGHPRRAGGGAAGGRAVVSVSATASTADGLDLSDLVKARQEIQRKEKENQGFTMVEIETMAPQDWLPATVDRVEEVASGVRCITLIAECSRELVKLDNAYRKAGQLAQVKVGGRVVQVPASSSPFSEKINAPVLYKIRGDIPAGTTKLPSFTLSCKAAAQLHVTDADPSVLYNIKEGDEVELGPWKATGLDLRPILFLTRYTTILLFAQGNGIAVARALLEAGDGDEGTLNLGLRREVRLFYSAPNPSLLAYKELYSKWEANGITKVRTIVERSYGEAWDGYEGGLTTLWDEDDLEYDPITTGVVVAVDSSKRKEVESLLEDAGIPGAQIVFWDV